MCKFSLFTDYYASTVIFPSADGISRGCWVMLIEWQNDCVEAAGRSDEEFLCTFTSILEPGCEEMLGSKQADAAVSLGELAQVVERLLRM